MLRLKFYLILSAILILSLGACQIPYQASDVFEKKAKLPDDEAPHLKNSLEWWYFTGHLEDSLKDKTLGVEYVVFHFNPTNLKGGWLINMAVSDPENRQFYYDHKFFTKKKKQFHEVPLDFNWDKKGIKSSLKGQRGDYSIVAEMSNHPISFELKTKPLKGVVLHDGVGYEQYGEYAKAGYYSYTQLETTGTLQLGKENFQLSGNLWYDRQWNCSGVFDRKVGWDWFSIQFEESNSELMVYRLYHLEKEEEIFGGTYIDAKGESIEIASDELFIEELAYWKSPNSEAIYPIKWKVSVPRLEIETTVEALFPNQELELKFRPFTKFYYWEGMCRAVGTISGKVVHGNSYVEMTNRHKVKE